MHSTGFQLHCLALIYKLLHSIILNYNILSRISWIALYSTELNYNLLYFVRYCTLMHSIKIIIKTLHSTALIYNRFWTALNFNILHSSAVCTHFKSVVFFLLCTHMHLTVYSTALQLIRLSAIYCIALIERNKHIFSWMDIIFCFTLCRANSTFLLLSR